MLETIRPLPFGLPDGDENATEVRYFCKVDAAYYVRGTTKRNYPANGVHRGGVVRDWTAIHHLPGGEVVLGRANTLQECKIIITKAILKSTSNSSVAPVPAHPPARLELIEPTARPTEVRAPEAALTLICPHCKGPILILYGSL